MINSRNLIYTNILDLTRHEVKDDTTRWFFVCQKGGTIK